MGLIERLLLNLGNMKGYTTCLIAILCFGLLHLSLAQTSTNYTMVATSNGSFDDMTGSTTIVGPNNNDGTYTPTFQTFNMDFLFMGEFWNSLKVSTNGIIWFGNTTDAFPAGANNVGDINNSRRISAFAINESGAGGEMATSASGKIHYKEFGTYPNRHVTIEFQNMSAPKTSGTIDVTTQVKIYETNSYIELIYDQVRINTTPTGTISAGFQTDNDNGERLTIDVSDDSFSYNAPEDYTPAGTGTIANVNSLTDGSRKIYTMESVAPDGNPSDLTSSCLGAYALRLDWTDNSTNELGFVVYGSTDGGTTFSRYTTAGANSTTAVITGLSPNTQYVFKVFSYTEGQVSGMTGSNVIVTTAPTGMTQSITSGNWNNTGTWSSGSTPNPSTDVVIGCLDNHTVTLTSNGSTNDLLIHSGSNLNFNATRTLSAFGNLANQGSMNLTNGTTELTVVGEFDNQGDFDFSGNNTDIDFRSNISNTGTWTPGSTSLTTIRGNQNIFVSNTGSTTTTSTTSSTSSGVISVAIPDNNTWQTNTITAPAGVSSLLSCTVDITHTYNDDLDLVLQAPDGNFITLSRDNGGSGNDYDNVTFIDSSPNTLPGGFANLSGDYQPEELFSTHTGTVVGNWTLYYKDDYTGDVGTLESWSLTFNVPGNTLTNTLGFHDLTLTNSSAAGIIVQNTDIYMDGTLTLTNGVMHLQDVADHKLIMDYTSSSGLPSDNSHIDGPVHKVGNSDFVFPVGDDGYAAAMSIEFGGGGNSDDEFSCRYFHQSPNNVNTLDPGAPYSTSVKDASIENVSNCEYWLLDQEVNTGTALSVHLSYHPVRSCGISSAPDLVVAHWTDKASASNRWKDEGHGGESGIGIFNSVIIDTYSPFTLGSTNGNPLPVEWLAFDAEAQSHHVDLSWSSIEDEETMEYIVQRSKNGANFEDIGFIKAINAPQISHYAFQDLEAFDQNSTILYYRLKQMDFDGFGSYSEIRSVALREEHEVINAFPNPFTNGITVIIDKEEIDEVDISLWTLDGKEIMSQHSSLGIGTNQFSLHTENLASGTYLLKVSTHRGTSVIKLQK